MIDIILRGRRRGLTKDNIMESIARSIVSSYKKSYASYMVSNNMINDLEQEENPYMNIDIEEHLDIIMGDRNELKRTVHNIKIKSDVFGLGIFIMMMWVIFLDLRFVPYFDVDDKFCSQDNDYPDSYADTALSLNPFLLSILFKNQNIKFEDKESIRNLIKENIVKSTSSHLSKDAITLLNEYAAGGYICILKDFNYTPPESIVNFFNKYNKLMAD